MTCHLEIKEAKNALVILQLQQKRLPFAFRDWDADKKNYIFLWCFLLPDENKDNLFFNQWKHYFYSCLQSLLDWLLNLFYFIVECKLKYLDYRFFTIFRPSISQIGFRETGFKGFASVLIYTLITCSFGFGSRLLDLKA